MLCEKFYPEITYDKISLSFFIKSKIEQIIFECIEETILNEYYDDSFFLLQKVIEYHISILKEQYNFVLRTNNRISSKFSFPVHRFQSNALLKDQTFTEFTREVSRSFDELNNKINSIIDRFVLQEFYYDIINTFELNNLSNSNYSNFFRDEGNIDKDKIENSVELAYNFILSTQNLLSKEEKDIPYIFEFRIKKSPSPILIIGIASKTEISEVKLLIKSNTHIERELLLKKENGIQTIPLANALYSGTYLANLTVKNFSGKHDIANKNFKID